MQWSILCRYRRCDLAAAALAVVVVAIGMAGSAAATSISINLWDTSAGNADFNNVDPGEVAGVVPIDGAHWNNVGFGHGNTDHTLTAAVMDD